MAFNYGRWSINDVIYTPFVQTGAYFCPFAYKDYFVNFDHIRYNSSNNYYNNSELDAVQFNIKFYGDGDAWTHPSANYSIGLPAVAHTTPQSLPIAILRDPTDTTKSREHGGDRDDIYEAAPYAALIYPRYKQDWEMNIYFQSANTGKINYTPTIEDTTVLSYYVDPTNGMAPGIGLKKFPRVSVIGLDANSYPTVNVPILGRPVGVELWFSQNDAQLNDQVYYSGYTHHTMDADLFAPHFIQKASNGYIRRYVCGWVRADADPATLTGADIMCGTLAEGTNANVWLETYVNGEYFPKLYTDANVQVKYPGPWPPVQRGRYGPLRYRAESIDPYEIPDQRIQITLTTGSNTNTAFGYWEGHYGTLTPNTVPKEIHRSTTYSYGWDKVFLYETGIANSSTELEIAPSGSRIALEFDYPSLPVGYRGLSNTMDDIYTPDYFWGGDAYDIKIAHDENNYMIADVVYNSHYTQSGGGNTKFWIEFDVTDSVGSGTYSDWVLHQKDWQDNPGSPGIINDFRIVNIYAANAFYANSVSQDTFAIRIEHDAVGGTNNWYSEPFGLEFNLKYVKFVGEDGEERYFTVHRFPYGWSWGPQVEYWGSYPNPTTMEWTWGDATISGKDDPLNLAKFNSTGGSSIFANNKTYTIELGFDKTYYHWWSGAVQDYRFIYDRPDTDRAVTRLYCDTQPWTRLSNFVFSNHQLAKDAFASWEAYEGYPPERDWADVIPTEQTWFAGYDPEIDYLYNGAQVPPDANLVYWYLGGGHEYDNFIQDDGYASYIRRPDAAYWQVNEFTHQIELPNEWLKSQKFKIINWYHWQSALNQDNLYGGVYALRRGQRYDYANFNCFDVKWVTYLDYVADDGEGAHIGTMTIPLPRMYTHPGYANTVSFAPMMGEPMSPFPYRTHYQSMRPGTTDGIYHTKSEIAGTNWYNYVALRQENALYANYNEQERIMLSMREGADYVGSITQDAVQLDLVLNGTYNNWNVSYGTEGTLPSGSTYYDYWLNAQIGIGLPKLTGTSTSIGVSPSHLPIETYLQNHRGVGRAYSAHWGNVDDWSLSYFGDGIGFSPGGLEYLRDVQTYVDDRLDAPGINRIENRWGDSWIHPNHDYTLGGFQAYHSLNRYWTTFADLINPRYNSYYYFYPDTVPNRVPPEIYDDPTKFRNGHQIVRTHFKAPQVSLSSRDVDHLNYDIPIFSGVLYLERYYSPNERRRNPYVCFSGYTHYAIDATGSPITIYPGTPAEGGILTDRHLVKVRYGIFDREADANTVSVANCRFGLFVDYDAASNTTTANVIVNGSIYNESDNYTGVFGGGTIVSSNRSVTGNINYLSIDWGSGAQESYDLERLPGVRAYPDDKQQSFGFIYANMGNLNRIFGVETSREITIDRDAFDGEYTDPNSPPSAYNTPEMLNAFRRSCFDTYNSKFLIYIECDSSDVDGHFGRISDMYLPYMSTHPGWTAAKNYDYILPNGRNYDLDIQWSPNLGHSVERLKDVAESGLTNSSFISSGIHPSTPINGRLPLSTTEWYKDIGERIIDHSSNGEFVYVRFEDSIACGGNNIFQQYGVMKGKVNKSGILTIDIEGSVEDSSTDSNYDGLVIMLNGSGYDYPIIPKIGQYGRFGILASAGSNANAYYIAASTRSASLCYGQKTPEIINYIPSGYYVEANDEIIVWANTLDNVSHQGSHYNIHFTIT